MSRIAGDGRRAWVRSLLVLSLLVQVAVLYAPTAGGPGPFPHSDKVVHLLVFLLPALLAGLARVPVALSAVVLVAHAVVSEVVQATVLASRTGDPFDVMADVLGVGLGGVLGQRLAGRGEKVP